MRKASRVVSTFRATFPAILALSLSCVAFGQAPDNHQKHSKISRDKKNLNDIGNRNVGCEVLPPLPEYKLDTSDFADMKAHLMQTQNHSGIDGGHDTGRPQLRRRTNTGDGEEGAVGDGDDHPTLKRRPETGDTPQQ